MQEPAGASLGGQAEVLQRVAQFKQLCLDVLAHDLRNPLAVARGRLELLGRRHEDVARDLEVVVASVDQATALLEEVLQFSREEEHGGQSFRPVNVAMVAVEVVTNLRPLGDARQVPLTLVTIPGSYAWAHPLLGHALENLITNAIKWSPPGRAVEVAVGPAGDRTRVVVVDHGPGIPPGQREALFRRFQRGNDDSKVPGTGLGLAIVKGILDLHQGSVQVEDTPGGGATFVLDVPMAAPKGAP